MFTRRLHLALVVLLALCSPGLAAAEPIRWIDHDEAVAAARRENKPLFVQFRAQWCLYCKLMERETFPDPALAGYLNEHYVSVMVDLDRDASVAQQYGVRRVPASMVIALGGKPKVRIGYLSAKQLLNLLATANPAPGPTEPGP